MISTQHLHRVIYHSPLWYGFKGNPEKKHSRTAIQVKVTSLGSLLWILPKWHFWRVCWSLDLSLPWCMEIGDMKLHLEFHFASEKNLLGTKFGSCFSDWIYDFHQILPGVKLRRNTTANLPNLRVFATGDGRSKKVIRNNHSQWIDLHLDFFGRVRTGSKRTFSGNLTSKIGKPHGLHLESLILESLMWMKDGKSQQLLSWHLGIIPSSLNGFELASCHGATFWVLQLRRFLGSNFEGMGRMVDV